MRSSVRSLAVAGLIAGALVAACGGSSPTTHPDGGGAADAAGEADGPVVDLDGAVPDAPVADAVPVDAGSPPVDAAARDGTFAGEGEVCGSSPAELDAGALPCAPGLVCCYPCGIPDCLDRCTPPCSGPGCSGGCPLLP